MNNNGSVYLRISFIWSCLFLLGLSACSPKLQLASTNKAVYVISSELPRDQKIVDYYLPYKLGLDSMMNEVVAVSTVARSALISKIRQEEKNVFLLDAGDIFQGTPYFNFYGGELEIKMMSMMGYDAGIMGNHDFDNGVEGFYKQLPHANFPILNANYDFSDTLLSGKIQPYKIFKKDGIKVGVFGLGIELTGLVNKQQYGNTVYLDPIAKALEKEKLLKLGHKCDLVVCLSHLGYKYEGPKVSDIVLARSTNYIDLIIGGHTYTFMDKPDSIRNLSGSETLVNQVGFAGINLGRIDFLFHRQNGQKLSYVSDLQHIQTNFKI